MKSMIITSLEEWWDLQKNHKNGLFLKNAVPASLYRSHQQGKLTFSERSIGQNASFWFASSLNYESTTATAHIKVNFPLPGLGPSLHDDLYNYSESEARLQSTVSTDTAKSELQFVLKETCETSDTINLLGQFQTDDIKGRHAIYIYIFLIIHWVLVPELQVSW